MQKPTVGRIVHFFPGSWDPLCRPVEDGPCAAIICRVMSDKRVNLCVYDLNGEVHDRQSVELRIEQAADAAQTSETQRENSWDWPTRA